MGENPTDDQVQAMLEQYGYMGNGSFVEGIGGSYTHAESMRMALMEYQSMAGIPQTGVVDAATVKMMNTPRCGVKDKTKKDATKRKRRYTVQGSMWSKNTLTYRISQYTNDLTQEEVDIEVANAFKLWSDVADLTFVRRSPNQRVDIDIRFVSGSHGDGAPFDGPGSVLAHAFFPSYGGDTHMDDDETWTINTYSGTNLLQVIAHEFGHSLGLEHSNIQSALMAAYYRGYIPDFKLDADDVMGIQAIYGAKKTPTIPPTPKPWDPWATTSTTTTMAPVAPEMMPMPCIDRRVSAMIQTQTGEVFAFYDNYYMRLGRSGIVEGYPQKIADHWQGAPETIDAAVIIPREMYYIFGSWTPTELLPERLYFFRGNLVFLYTSGSTTMEPGYPKLIADVFPGLPNDIDGGFQWGRNGRTYFFKDNAYYRYSHGRTIRTNSGNYEEPGRIDSSYPRDISVWKGVPRSGIDAVFVYNGYTFFFSGMTYYRFHDYYVQVYNGYPRLIGEAWFGCSSNLEDGTEQTTMMMEVDMPNMPKFETMDPVEGPKDNDEQTDAPETLDDGDISAQTNLRSSCSLLLGSVLLLLALWR